MGRAAGVPCTGSDGPEPQAQAGSGTRVETSELVETRREDARLVAQASHDPSLGDEEQDDSGEGGRDSGGWFSSLLKKTLKDRTQHQLGDPNERRQQHKPPRVERLHAEPQRERRHHGEQPGFQCQQSEV